MQNTTNEHIPYLLETLIGLYHSRLHQLLSISIIIHKPLSLNYPALKLEIISFRFPRSFFFLSNSTPHILSIWSNCFLSDGVVSFAVEKSNSKGIKAIDGNSFEGKIEKTKKGKFYNLSFLTCSFYNQLYL